MKINVTHGLSTFVKITTRAFEIKGNASARVLEGKIMEEFGHPFNATILAHNDGVCRTKIRFTPHGDDRSTLTSDTKLHDLNTERQSSAEMITRRQARRGSDHLEIIRLKDTINDHISPLTKMLSPKVLSPHVDACSTNLLWPQEIPE